MLRLIDDNIINVLFATTKSDLYLSTYVWFHYTMQVVLSQK